MPIPAGCGRSEPDWTRFWPNLDRPDGMQNANQASAGRQRRNSANAVFCSRFAVALARRLDEMRASPFGPWHRRRGPSVVAGPKIAATLATELRRQVALATHEPHGPRVQRALPLDSWCCSLPGAGTRRLRGRFHTACWGGDNGGAVPSAGSVGEKTGCARHIGGRAPSPRDSPQDPSAEQGAAPDADGTRPPTTETGGKVDCHAPQQRPAETPPTAVTDERRDTAAWAESSSGLIFAVLLGVAQNKIHVLVHSHQRPH